MAIVSKVTMQTDKQKTRASGENKSKSHLSFENWSSDFFVAASVIKTTDRLEGLRQNILLQHFLAMFFG